MRALAIAAGLIACAALALGAAVILRAIAIRRRHRSFSGAPLPLFRPDAERLFESARALYNGTSFADGARLLEPLWARPCVADLALTAEAIFLEREAGEGRLAIPLVWIEDASLLRAHAALAGKELPVLRIVWKRGGQALRTELSLRGGMAQLEKLRREIHLRQGQGSALAQLQRFLQPPGEGKP